MQHNVRAAVAVACRCEDGYDPRRCFAQVPLDMGTLKKSSLIAAALAVMTAPAFSAPWVRGFVVDNYEPAFYYGARGGTEAPGTDCPKGTIPILDYKKELKTSWRTEAEITKITLPVCWWT